MASNHFNFLLNGNHRRNSTCNPSENKRSNFKPSAAPNVCLPDYEIPKDLRAVYMADGKPLVQITPQGLAYMKLIQKLKNHANLKVDEKSILKIMKVLLYIEEIQQEIEMKQYDRKNIPLEMFHQHNDIYYRIYISDLAEERPSVRPGDFVTICNEKKNNFKFCVLYVRSDHIVIRDNKGFFQVYKKEEKYTVKFHYFNYTDRCCHYALLLTESFGLTSILFPVKRSIISKQNNIEFCFNENILNNPEQKQAILNICEKSCAPAPYILWGPPGTGKTSTLVEAICQICMYKEDKILVCTPSNTAADVITKRILEYIPTLDKDIYRMYSFSKEGSPIDDTIMECSNSVDGTILMLPKKTVLEKRIVICTLCAATRLIFLGLKEKHFSYIFIDEAGQATEPETLQPINLAGSMKEGRFGTFHSQLILAGDPKQLGPGIRSKLAAPILGKSMMERLMESEPYKKNEHNQYNPRYISKLIHNYRSHPAIIEVSNKLFYDNELKAHADAEIKITGRLKNLVSPNFPLLFCGIDGKEIRDNKTPSLYNKPEIKAVIDYVKIVMEQSFQNKKMTEADIGIVTPFTAQRMMINQALSSCGFNKINVGTVELFQGEERNVIIVSTVRSQSFFHDNKHHLGFLSHPKRFNVAITRAKCLLIVIGNPNVLQMDEYWYHFIDYCMTNGAYVGIPFFKKRESLTQKLRDLNINKTEENVQSILNDDLAIINLDDGIIEDSKPTANLQRQNNYPSTSYSQSNLKPQSILADYIVPKINETQKKSKNAKKKTKKTIK
ncbi:putative helicase mov-10-B.1 [Trichogramma pretiosum]|uniref:putative helicase mov-10-B.1 n=1 Tax=Trichogramma pretiosum TaxID=7493 RepID=UPI0006C94F01|nr:putative helicase mov-10-B.1 [Trichogramma pretiosum]XP_014225089.1 putative helicase mov-10-B.1 [Trichogramma pretiosum]XP_014225090.1 putative helicase mov-10-B.1 [Trichogramma pretiosum]XP_014225091.1 putative helicase mov-10-B.1 [Trichogramma pretiosum]XP_014225092.1 putative helicase mov-10-B.1 [Trichogramma pretiosum]